LIKDKPEKLVIDLSNVSYIDSAGLAVLIDGMQKVEAYRGKALPGRDARGRPDNL